MNGCLTSNKYAGVDPAAAFTDPTGTETVVIRWHGLHPGHRRGTVRPSPLRGTDVLATAFR